MRAVCLLLLGIVLLPPAGSSQDAQFKLVVSPDNDVSSMPRKDVARMFLKRTTHHNIVLGGIAGAAPPLLGWTAVTGEIHPEALLLFLIIFIWTPPHFWPLAIKKRTLSAYPS